MKKLAYKSLCIGTLFLGAAAFAHAAGFTGGSKRANVPASAIPPPVVYSPPSPDSSAIVSVPAPAPQTPVSVQTSTTLQSSATPSAESITSLGASGALDATQFVQEIKTTTASNRARLTADLDARLSANTGALDALRSRSSEIGADNTAKLVAAQTELKAREQALKSSLDAARQSTTENWSALSGTLASDYEAYAKAVKDYEAIFPNAMIGTSDQMISSVPASSVQGQEQVSTQSQSSDQTSAHDTNNDSRTNSKPQAGPNRVPTELQ